VKLLVEIVIGFLLFVLSANFWSCVKSPSWRTHFLNDYESLREFYLQIGSERLREEGSKIEPLLGDYGSNIGLLLRSSSTALAQVRNVLFLIIGVAIVGSYYLSVRYSIVNLVLFGLMGLPSVSTPAKNNMLTDVWGIILNIYKWNSVDPDGCGRYCSNGTSRLETLYRVVNESTRSQSPLS
jgi:hypothetical protein